MRERLEALAAERGVTTDPAAVLEEGEAIEETVEWRHRPTHRLDEDGQGDAHVQYAFSAHRAVVDVDTELGLVRVVELATAQEVGKAMNPQALEGQIEGGSAQGLGLALLEEIQIEDGKVLNASFTDYLLPTILDMPPMRIEVLEHADPEAPYGLKGVGEPPNISTPPAIAAALRAATGRALPRIPVRPEHLVGLDALEDFVARYGAIFESSPWVARAAFAEGPFAGVDDLHAALVAAVREAPRERQLELIRAHPELAGREAQAGELTAASAGEQASAGLRSPDRRRGRALARAQRRLPRALRLPARRLRARAHQGVDPRLGRGAPGPRARGGGRDRPGRDRQDRAPAPRGARAMITTHVLDTARGRPAAGVPIVLERATGDGWQELGRGATDADGRLRDLVAEGASPGAGRYRLTFDTGAYFRDRGEAAFYPEVAVVFTVAADEHHHVPLLLSPFGYSTYRGS